MLGWDPYGFDKKRIGTRYAELVFLRHGRSTCHIVHFPAYKARNIGAIFFDVMWARCCFRRNHAGTRYTELVFQHLVGFVWCIWAMKR
jgi:hypothetical protein